MKNLTKKIFRDGDKITVTSDSGTLEGRGVITAFGKDEAALEPSEIGLLSTPLYLYMGDCTGLREKNTVTCDDKSYRVISCRVITGFGRVFCMRAVMERIENEHN